MFNEDHYAQCSAIFNEMVDKKTSTYTKVVEPKRAFRKVDGGEIEYYINGCDDENSYRKGLIDETLASGDFKKFYANLTSRDYMDKFYLFGRMINIDTEKEIIRILDFSLKTCIYLATSNRVDQTKNDFRNLYYSLYEDKFIIKVDIVLKNLVVENFVETELLNQGKGHY